MTEASVFICLQPDGKIKVDSVGPAAPDVQIRLAETGEVLVKSPGVFRHYYKNDAATAEVLTADGWILVARFALALALSSVVPLL